MNIRYFISVILALLSTQLIASQSITQEVRKVENINSNWKFTRNDAPEQRDVNYDDSKWRILDLPHDWSIESDYTPNFPAGFNNGFFEEGIGWYRKEFVMPKDNADKQVVIQFDGVFMNSEVWINGKFLGKRPYGYSTFRYDITENLKFGAKNVIAVRVDNSNPGADRWYHGSGIYRDVYLLTTNYVHFKHNGGVHIKTPTAEKDRAVVSVDYEIMGSFFDDKEIKLFKTNRWQRPEDKWKVEPRNHKCIIRSIVYDANGKEVKREETNCNIKNYEMSYKLAQSINIESPKRWSDKTPNLYTMHSEIEYNGKILDDVVTTFGIRKIEFIADKGLYINGEETKLNGVCLHQEAGSLGAAITDRVWEFRLKKLKEMGCNAVRTAHSPFSPAFYDQCDKLGILVMDESFDEWTCGWNVNWTENTTGKAKNGYNLLFEQWWKTDLSDLIKRDRNHPSIIIWGIGNEIPDYRHFKKSGKIAKEMVELCNELDSTRPESVGDNNSKRTEANGVTKVLPLLGFNYIERDYGQDTMYAVIHKKYPERLCFGSEVNKELCYQNAVRDNKYVIGNFIWTGIDYLGETKDKNLRGWNTSLLDMSLNKRYEGALYEVCWKKDPCIYITTGEVSADSPIQYKQFSQAGERIAVNNNRTFSWNNVKGKKLFVTVYNNCDEIELLINGKTQGKAATNSDKYFAEFEVVYAPGKVEAVGYRNGKKVVKTRIETTGNASSISAIPYFNNMKRDGKDMNIIEVNVTDDKGRTIPDAQNSIKVEVSGGAKLAGVDSPNLYYKGSYKVNERAAENGHLLVTIQSNGKDLPAIVKLTSPGLKDRIIEIK